MNLIISLLGSDNDQLITEKFLIYKKKNTLILDAIVDRYSFCKNIFVITKKNMIKNNFNKSKKIKYIFAKSSKNQIISILKAKKFISLSEKVLILNPDSSFDINKTVFNEKCDAKIFYINKNNISRSFGKKDILYSNKNNEIKKIEKKSSYPFAQRVSAGLYYLERWGDFLKYSKKIKNINNSKLNVIDVFLEILKNKKIKLNEVKNFICFENKKKIKEYIFWKKYFKNNAFSKDKLKKIDIQNIIPSAGEGSRHRHLGFNLPKPLIPISGKTMFEKSLESLPNKNNNLFIFRKKTFFNYKLIKKFPKKNKKSIFFNISKKTKGMAITISRAKKYIKLDKPVIVSSCDLKCVIDYENFYNIIKKENPDAMIFTWSQYPFASESPNSHAYVKAKNSIVKIISEKKTISSDPDNDSAVTGIFYFKSGQELMNCIDYSLRNKITVNGEYYVATAMTKLLNENKKIIDFKVNQMISWSLPEHLMDYLYWEKIFKKS